METHIILVVAAILLSGGCFGLAIVRLTNPFFKGAGWLGGSFASGAIGAAIFLLRLGHWGDFAILMAYIFVLSGIRPSYVCLWSFPR